MTKTIFNTDQLNRLTAAFRVICSQRDVRLGSKEGLIIATRLLHECTGDENETEIVRRFSH